MLMTAGTERDRMSGKRIQIFRATYAEETELFRSDNLLPRAIVGSLGQQEGKINENPGRSNARKVAILRIEVVNYFRTTKSRWNYPTAVRDAEC